MTFQFRLGSERKTHWESHQLVKIIVVMGQSYPLKSSTYSKNVLLIMLLMLMLLITLYHPPTKQEHNHPNFDANTIYRENISTYSTLIPSQTQIQPTIIMVIYTQTGLGDNKYQNFGWYKHIPGRTNPKPRSQTKQTVPIFSVQTQCLVHTF